VFNGKDEVAHGPSISGHINIKCFAIKIVLLYHNDKFFFLIIRLGWS